MRALWICLYVWLAMVMTLWGLIISALLFGIKNAVQYSSGRCCAAGHSALAASRSKQSAGTHLLDLTSRQWSSIDWHINAVVWTAAGAPKHFARL